MYICDKEVSLLELMYAKVALIQTDIRPESVDCNLRTIEQLIATAPQSDLYVLPETFATGFAADPNEAAKAEQKIIEMMTRVVTKSDCAICGSLIVERDGRYRNRLLFVTPEGIESYDKRHLFSIGGEGEQYTAGTERVAVEWRGIRWLLSTCYDLRFPVWLRNRGDYDAMICVAGGQSRSLGHAVAGTSYRKCGLYDRGQSRWRRPLDLLRRRLCGLRFSRTSDCAVWKQSLHCHGYNRP